MIPIGVEALVDVFERSITPDLPQSNEWYPWHPLSLTGFYTGMEDARRLLGPGRFKFLDVGSGIGTKLYLADRLGFEPHGIELKQEYIEVCDVLWPEYPVTRINALEYDRYSEFDVIYSYRIARQPQLQHEVNKRITAMMRPGAFVFLAGTDPIAQLQGVKQEEEVKA